jgi:hypothetical protein
VAEPAVQYPLIGLTGRARAGKDTFASGLVERGYTRVALADPLREMVEAMDPWLVTPPWQHEPNIRLRQALEIHGGWEGIKATNYGPEARRLLQRAGVAVRELDPDFWVRAAMAKVERILHDGGAAVITDVRFPNEADAIEWAGGVIVRIERPGLPTDDTHVSETALAGHPVDFTVYNRGSAEELVELARTIRF